MDINKTQHEDTTTLTLSGKLDTSTAPQLQEVLIPAFDTSKHVELNCSALSYVSSAGLRVLLMGEKTAKATGGHLTLSHVASEVMEVFEMTGFSDILTVV